MSVREFGVAWSRCAGSSHAFVIPCVGFRATMRVGCVFSVLSVAGALRLSPAGGPLDTLVGVFENAPVELHESRADVDATSEIMRSLGSQPAPPSPIASRLEDPERHHAFAWCDRDFAQPCPDQFESVAAGKCAPGSGYEGPCGGDARSFDGLSAVAKGRWSDVCLAWWPCVECQRDYSTLCPVGWVVEGGARCTPTAAYAGPCGASADFSGYTRDMFAQWSSSCGADWPCSGAAGSGA